MCRHCGDVEFVADWMTFDSKREVLWNHCQALHRDIHFPWEEHYHRVENSLDAHFVAYNIKRQIRRRAFGDIRFATTSLRNAMRRVTGPRVEYNE